MKNTLKYKRYVGSVVFSAEDRIFHGRILGINDIVSFEGAGVEELENDFHEAVENYLEACEKIGKEPEKPFSGKFVVRIPSELHSAVALRAKQEEKSINSWIKELFEQTLSLRHA